MTRQVKREQDKTGTIECGWLNFRVKLYNCNMFGPIPPIKLLIPGVDGL
jgi:hypothetical protein